MANNISVKAPLRIDETFGYAMNNSHRDLVKQNLKMLILTNPGERVMIPNFGVGIIKFLFEFPTAETNGAIISKIQEQVGLFMPFLNIEDITITEDETESALFVKIKYFIVPLAISDDLDIDVKV